MTRAIAHTYSKVYEFRRQITTAVIMLCALTALIYAVNLYRVISHTIALQQIEKQAVTLNTNIDTLDGKYLVLSKTITPDTLTSKGFDTGTVTAFISRTTSLGSAVLVGHEL